jgi:hypothetical protein
MQVPESGRRYPELERKFVSSVCMRAGMGTNGRDVAAEKIVDHVEERLAKGAEEYGNIQFWQVPIIGEKKPKSTPLICELQEEAADILGWGALTSIRFREKGWLDLVTKLEVATTGVIHYGHGLKAIEEQVRRRLDK